MNDKVSVTKLNEILPNSTPNVWYIQVYVQGFDCEYITFKIAVNMFESMDISESIYEGVVEPSDKKPTWADANCDDNSSQKRGESALLWTHPNKGERYGKRRKRHGDIPTRKLINCLIHGPGHSSE